MKKIVAEPCYITDTERHLHKLNTALRNLYYPTEQLCFEAEHSVIGADLFVEMRRCSERMCGGANAVLYGRDLYT